MADGGGDAAEEAGLIGAGTVAGDARRSASEGSAPSGAWLPRLSPGGGATPSAGEVASLVITGADAGDGAPSWTAATHAAPPTTATARLFTTQAAAPFEAAVATAAPAEVAAAASSAADSAFA